MTKPTNGLMKLAVIGGQIAVGIVLLALWEGVVKLLGDAVRADLLGRRDLAAELAP